MKNLPSALMWSGVALFLLPFALICLFVMAALVIASPVVGIFLVGLIFLCIGWWRDRPAHTEDEGNDRG